MSAAGPPPVTIHCSSLAGFPSLPLLPMKLPKQRRFAGRIEIWSIADVPANIKALPLGKYIFIITKDCEFRLANEQALRTDGRLACVPAGDEPLEALCGHSSILPYKYWRTVEQNEDQSEGSVIFAGGITIVPHGDNMSGHFQPGGGDAEQDAVMALGFDFNPMTFTFRQSEGSSAHEAYINVLDADSYALYDSSFGDGGYYGEESDYGFPHVQGQKHNVHSRHHYHENRLDHSLSLPYGSYGYANEHYENGEYQNGLLIGGVIGGGSIAVLLVVLCVGLALGVLACFGYKQKKELDERNEQNWRQEDNAQPV
eukprot:243792_1